MVCAQKTGRYVVRARMHNTSEYIIYELVCIRAWILYHSTNSLYAYSLVLYYY